MARRIIRITANFERNLADVRRFLDEREAPQALDALVAHLFDGVVPNLESFPAMGRAFLERSPLSVEGRALQQKVIQSAGSRWRLREYITGDYLILYAVAEDAVALLALRHHRQLSFDLRAHWA